MSKLTDRAQAYLLPYKKTFSRSLESFFDTRLRYTRIREDSPDRRRKLSAEHIIDPDEDNSEFASLDSNLSIDGRVTTQRSRPIDPIEFSLLETMEPASNTEYLTLAEARKILKTFDGESRESLYDFLRTADFVFSKIKPEKQAELLAYLQHVNLQGKAAQVMAYKTIGSYEEFKSTLESMYREVRTKGAVFNDLYKSQQKAGESAAEFGHRIERLYMELARLSISPTISEEAKAVLQEFIQDQAKHIFETGLRGRLGILVQSKNFTSLQAAIAGAVEIETNSFREPHTEHYTRHNTYDRRSLPLKCTKCNRNGHLARDCYARSIINRHSTPVLTGGPVNRNVSGYRNKRSDNNLIYNAVCRDSETRDNVSKSSTSRQGPITPKHETPRAQGDTSDRARSTIERHKIRTVREREPWANHLEIYSDDFEDQKAIVLYDTGADVSLMKIGKVKGCVETLESTTILEGIGQTPITTICQAELRIKIGAAEIRHTCHIVPDDFPIEADGILGMDFITMHKVRMEPGELTVSGVTIPLKSFGTKMIPPRSEVIMRVSTLSEGEGLIEKQEITQGVFLAECLTRAKDGMCTVGLINITEEEVAIPDLTVRLKNIAPSMNDTKTDDKATALVYRTRQLSGAERMRRLRDSIRTNHLNNEEINYLYEACEEYNDLFCLEGDKLEGTSAVEHGINTLPGTSPINIKPYRLPQKHKDEVERQVNEMLEAGIVRPSTSQWNAPLLVVPKKMDSSGKMKMRVVVDFRKLNDVTIGDSYPLPNITEILDQLGGAKYFTTLDLASGFHQIRMKEEDKCKTAFSTPLGHYEYNRMPFGLKNAPATFQRLMNTVLSGLQGLKCFVYLDDIVIHARSLKEHDERLRAVFEQLRKNKLRLQPDKCEFLRKETSFLGHVITADGIKPDPAKVKAVCEFPTPATPKHVQSFLGLASYYRRFIENFSKIAKPLTALLKKGAAFQWTDKEQEAFETLKLKLTTTPILQYPDFTKTFILTTDASDKAVGAVLSQGEIGRDLPIAYASRVLNKAETNYSTTEKELLAIVWGVNHFRPYLYGTKFTIVTDHKPLTWLFSVKDPGSRLMRWRLKLEEYDYEIVYKAGRANTNADALSRMHVNTCVQKNQVTADERQQNADIESENDAITEEDKKRILYEHHDAPLGGHQGVTRTYERIKLKYNWPGMKRDIENYVSKCEKCQKNKLGTRTKMPMVITDTPEHPFEKCSLDVVGPMPTTTAGNKYILTFQDSLTKFSKAIAIPDQEANTIAREFTTKIICEYGIPKRILTDQGTNFLSEIFKGVCKLLRIDKIQTTAYHPQSNGALERTHKTLADYLKNFVNEDQTNWDQWLPYAIFSYNTTPHTATNYTPYELVFGRLAELPTSLRQEPQPIYNYESYAKEMKERIRTANLLARENLTEAKEKSKKYYDRDVKLRTFKVGQKVMLKDEAVRRGRSRKLSNYWIGPYVITKRINPENYVIKKGKREIRVHANRLKNFI